MPNKNKIVTLILIILLPSLVFQFNIQIGKIQYQYFNNSTIDGLSFYVKEDKIMIIDNYVYWNENYSLNDQYLMYNVYKKIWIGIGNVTLIQPIFNLFYDYEFLINYEVNNDYYVGIDIDLKDITNTTIVTFNYYFNF